MWRVEKSRALLSFRLVVVALCILDMAQIVVGQGTFSNSVTSVSRSVGSDKLPDDIEQVLWWLPEETEAVVVSKGNVPIKEFRSTTPPPGGNSSAPSVTPAPGYVYPTYKYDYQDLVAMNCIEPLVSETGLCQGDLHAKMLKAFYGPKSASLFVKAVWWEKEQTRASCDIVLFRDDMAAQIVKAFSTLRNVPFDIDGVHVLEVDLNANVTPESYLRYYGRPLKHDFRYLAAPQSSVYFATTNRQLMGVLIERMKRHGANRALPADLPEWQQFDPSVPAWGIRHYRSAVADKDLTSMLKRDSNAKGLVFFGGNNPSSFLCLRYVSKSDDAGKRFVRFKADYLNRKDASTLRQMDRINVDCVESRLRTNVPKAEAIQDEEGSWTAEATFHCIDTIYLPFLGFTWPEMTFKSM